MRCGLCSIASPVPSTFCFPDLPPPPPKPHSPSWVALFAVGVWGAVCTRPRPAHPLPAACPALTWACVASFCFHGRPGVCRRRYRDAQRAGRVEELGAWSAASERYLLRALTYAVVAVGLALACFLTLVHGAYFDADMGVVWITAVVVGLLAGASRRMCPRARAWLWAAAGRVPAPVVGLGRPVHATYVLLLFCGGHAAPQTRVCTSLLFSC
jgi:hypothetical protein